LRLFGFACFAGGLRGGGKREREKEREREREREKFIDNQIDD
jgi:hypothetical protein